MDTIIPVVIIFIIFRLILRWRRKNNIIMRSVEYDRFITQGSRPIIEKIKNMGIKTSKIPVELDSLQKFRNFNPEDYMMDIFEKDKNLFKELKDLTYYIHKLFEEGNIKLDRLLNELDNLENDIEPFIFHGIRTRMEVDKRWFVDHIEQPIFIMEWTYTSPAGRNHYKNSTELLIRDIMQILRNYNERRKYQKSMKYQRDKMTPGLRYDIMKRDNYKCRICGITAREGAKLHIDHIIPVSKGGKTEPDNLQTLCKTCNLGKGTKSL